MTDQVQPVTASPPAFVVFGRDDAGKPHASSFAEADAALAEKAAGMMGMRTLVIKNDTQRALAAKLPRGKIFASGKGFVPFVKAPLFAELELASPGGEVLSKMPGKKKAAAAVAANNDAAVTDEASLSLQPKDWDSIQAGAIVLAAAAPLHQSWFECVVIKIVGGDLLTLRYADWPNEEPFTRHRSEVGLINPSREIEPPLSASENQTAAA